MPCVNISRGLWNVSWTRTRQETFALPIDGRSPWEIFWEVAFLGFFLGGGFATGPDTLQGQYTSNIVSNHWSALFWSFSIYSSSYIGILVIIITVQVLLLPVWYKLLLLWELLRLCACYNVLWNAEVCSGNPKKKKKKGKQCHMR